MGRKSPSHARWSASLAVVNRRSVGDTRDMPIPLATVGVMIVTVAECPPLRDRLRHRSHEVFDAAVAEAVAAGSKGEQELAAVIRLGTWDRHVSVAAALGDAEGTAGPTALRSVLDASGPGSRDLRAPRCSP